MTRYLVVGRIEYIYEVDADTPEYAASVVEEGDAGQGECVDAWVERVVLPDARGEYDPMADEVRKPTWCSDHRRSVSPGSTCVDCLLGWPAA
jgi:hypothetical protein